MADQVKGTAVVNDGADMPTWQMFVGGEWGPAASGAYDTIETPAVRGKAIARVARAGTEDVDRAVRSARDAFGAWKGEHFKTRQKALVRIADAIEARTEELATLTARDTGNALRTQARPEVGVLVDMFRYFGGVAGEVKGTTLPAGDGQLQYTRREPLGVVGAILPWNSPLMIAAFKIPAALAAGNTMVVKAAEDAPLTVLLLAEICAEFLPPGVLNVFSGTGEEAGAALVAHPGVDKVSFTGSTEVGKMVAVRSAERMAHVSLELGGKNPNIVFGDVTVDDALITGLLTSSRFHRQGQSCTAGSRLFLHEDVHDEVLEKLVAAMDQLVVGDPSDEKTDIGAVINQAQWDRIDGYLRDGREHPDMTAVLGGSAPSEGPLTEGFYHLPTVFSGGRNDFRLNREEIFGPVLVAIPWREVDDVVRMANDTNYGLAAYVWGRDVAQVLSTAHRLEAGWVQVNQGGGQMAGQSYGGYKESGVGREVSLEGMLAGFTQTKQINVNLAG
ncbi:aldehyde dehydrogenase family protein [Mariniluteicoccus flavus]